VIRILPVRDLEGMFLGFSVEGPDGTTFHKTLFAAFKAYDIRRAA